MPEDFVPLLQGFLGEKEAVTQQANSPSSPDLFAIQNIDR